MANPYYIPVKDPISSFVDAGMRSYLLVKQMKLEKEHLRLQEEQQARLGRESEAKYGRTAIVEPESRYATGEGGVMNLPGDRGGVSGYIPGLEQRKAGREERGLQLQEEAGGREERDPLATHDQYMTETPNVDRLRNLAGEMPGVASHIEALVGKVYSGKVKDRWDAFRFVKDRRPQILRDLKSQRTQMLEANENADTTVVDNYITMAESGTFAEQLFHFPAERMGGETRAGLLKEARAVRKEQRDIEKHNRQMEKLNTEIKKAKKDGRYTEEETRLVDDTRAFYNQKMRALFDEDGFLPDANKAEYDRLLGDLEADLSTIAEGQMPSWYGGKQPEAKAQENDPFKIR